MKKVLYSALISGLFALIALVGCSPEQDTAGESDSTIDESSGGELVIASVREPDTVDVHNTTWVDDANTHLYDRLFYFDESGNIVNGLVEDYTVSDDSKSITFVLKEGATFHDGDPVTSQDVVDSFQRYLDVSAGSHLGPITKMEVDDDKTFTIHWEEPFAPFFSNTTTAYLGVMDTSVLNEDNMGFEENPIASGPLKHVETNRGESIVYEPYADFDWGGEGAPQLDKVTFRFIPDDETRMLEFKKGTVHVLPDVPPQYIEELESDPEVTMDKVPGNGNTYLGFNMKQPIFEDIRVRHAISLAIDRQPIIDHSLQGNAQPVYGPLPPTIFGYSQRVEDMAKDMFSRDIEKAKGLLAEAGWDEVNDDGIVIKDGQPFSVELASTDEPVIQRIGQIIQNQLKEVGIEVRLAVKEDAAMRAEMPEGRHEMILWQYGWYDADILYRMFKEGQSTRMHWSPPELEEMLGNARAVMDPQERLLAYEEGLEYLVEQAPWVPLFVREGVTASKGVENFKKHPIQDVIEWPGMKLGH